MIQICSWKQYLLPRHLSAIKVLRKRCGDVTVKKVSEFEKLDFKYKKVVLDIEFLNTQGCSQNLKQVPQLFKLTMSHWFTSPSNHCCQISFIVQERAGISLIIHFVHFLRRHSRIFKSLKPVYSYACMLATLYQFEKKLTKHFPANIYLFKVRIVIMR